MKRLYSKSILNISAAGLLIATGVVSSGCDNFLDKFPTASISDASFWNDENDAYMALIGVYRAGSGWDRNAFDTHEGLMFLDLAGGNGTEKEDFTTRDMASSETSATSGQVAGYWNNSCSRIAHCHTFLDNIGDCPMDEGKKELWSAEVRAIRAFFYFYLAFHFKDVPMPLTSLTVQEANTIHQTPQAEVYKFVEDELKDVLTILPDSWDASERGRYTTGAVRVILGRLYLAQQRWADAAAAFKAVIDSGLYELDRRNGDESYEKLFLLGGETSPEIIYGVNYIENLYTHVHYIYYYPEILGGWHLYAIYNELVKDYYCADGKDTATSAVYDDDDPYTNRELRLYASVFLPPVGSWPGTELNDRTYDCFGAANSSDRYDKFPKFNGYCPKKSLDPSFSGSLFDSYVHLPLMRYAEVLLSYLEALNEADPGAVDQQVLDLTINDVRDRVKLTPFSIADIGGQSQLRDLVRKERRIELAFEGFRYYDVLRWGTAIDELNHYFTGVKLSDDPGANNYRGASPVDSDNYYQFERRTWAAHNRYFPIPQSQLNINPNLVPQEGYN